MIDIHCHILYSIDDGAEDFQASINMAEVAECNGTKAIIATPHCNIPDMHEEYDKPIILDRVNCLNEKLRSIGSDLRIYTGSEIFATGDVVEKLKSGQLLTLNDSVYTLIEFDFYEHPASVFVKLEAICSEGFVPVVAHPERYAFVKDDDTAIDRLKKMGCLVQLNKGSICGRFGKEVALSAHRMLVKEQADFVASDAHSPVIRTPVLCEAYSMVEELCSADYAELLFKINPAKVLNNQKI